MSFSFIFFNFLWCIVESTNIYLVDPNTMLATVCFNGGKPNLFKVRVDVALVDLKDQLDQIIRLLNHRDTKRVEKCWVSTSIDQLSLEIVAQLDDAHKRHRREEVVLDI